MSSRISVWASGLKSSADTGLTSLSLAVYGRRGSSRQPLGRATPRRPLTRPANPLPQPLLAQLKQALAHSEFQVYYQPRLTTASRQLLSVEALVRWPHPQRGLVSPTEFIPLAEETGFIIPLGAWVLRAACHQTAQWAASGLGDLSVSVNVAAQQLTADFFEVTVPQALAESGLAPTHLELELTETSSIGALEPATLRAIQALRAQGVRIFLDDFGTGYSSLAYLHKLPLDGLKLDRSFVSRLPEAADAQAIVKAILAMADALNLATVAEGIETAAQAQWLTEQGCDELQGFLFSKPVDALTLAGLLRASSGTVN